MGTQHLGAKYFSGLFGYRTGVVGGEYRRQSITLK